MAYFERTRDILNGPLTNDLLRQRADAGWQVASIEWRRELPGNAPIESRVEDIPYGLRISEDCLRLEIDPEENHILMQMMELLVQDFPFTSVASDLNEKGAYRTKESAGLRGVRLQHAPQAGRSRPDHVPNRRMGDPPPAFRQSNLAPQVWPTSAPSA